MLRLKLWQTYRIAKGLPKEWPSAYRLLTTRLIPPRDKLVKEQASKEYESTHAASQTLANLEDCQRNATGLPKECHRNGLWPTYLSICSYIINFVQHYCTLKYYRIFATLLHKVVFSFPLYNPFFRNFK